MAQEPIWPGSGSAVSGNTPFGFYDTDSEFQGEAPKFATWCAQRLGFPLMNVELQDKQFYACLEESVSEYSAQINQFNIKDSLLSLQGQSTSSNLTHKRISIIDIGSIQFAIERCLQELPRCLVTEHAAVFVSY